MGRHAAELPPDDGPEPRPQIRDSGRPGPVASWGRPLAAALVVALAVGGGAWIFWQLRGSGDTASADAGDATTRGETDCEEVLVMAAAGAEPVVQEALASVPTPADGPCVDVRVLDRAPAQVLADMEAGSAPDVWVPDSSVWLARASAAGVGVQDRGSLGSSPVVVATGAAAAEALGWTAEPPSWSQVLATTRGIAVGPLPSESAPLLVLGAAMQDAGVDASGMGQIAAALTLGQSRAGAASAEAGLAGVSGTDALAPLVLLSAVDAARAGAGNDGGALVVVEPTGPVSPVLDYPLITVPDTQRSERSVAATAAVVAALTTAAGTEAAVAAGLAPPLAPDAAVLRTFTPEQLGGLVAAFEALATPSELLVVVDVSTSMLAPVPGAGSRADVAAAALGNALTALPPQSRVGLWYFANDVDGERDYREVLPIERLDAVTSAGTQRDALAAQLTDLPQSLVPGGTSLYQVTLDAVAAAKEQRTDGYDTTVVLITDGQNEDSAGPSLEQVTASLSAEQLTEEDGTLGFLPIAFGTDADLEAVTALASAAQGLGGLVQPVNATDAVALEQLLIIGLSARLDP